MAKWVFVLTAVLLLTNLLFADSSGHLSGDISGPLGLPDGVVNFFDLAVMADEWANGDTEQLLADIAGTAGVGQPDGVVNFIDFAVLAGEWFAANPTLDDLYAGTAHFTFDQDVGDNPLFLCYTSMQWQGSEIWAYYLKFYDYDAARARWRLGVGRARSTDGASWTDDGFVLKPGGEAKWWYSAISQLYHQMGRSNGTGWVVGTSYGDPAGYSCYGPYTTLTPGQKDAIFILAIGSPGTHTLVARIEVYNATTAQVIASQDLYRDNFVGAWTDNAFHLNFTWPGGSDQIELRTYWYQLDTLIQKWANVAEGNYINAYKDHWDSGYASFPGIWKDGSTWYIAYEGAIWRSPSLGWEGDIGLATSSDGLNFYRTDPTVIMQNNSTGWEQNSIGTPMIQKFGSYWYAYYHGYDLTDVRIGFANGSSLFSLTKYGYNPVINTSASGWDAGTCGKKSHAIQASSGYYYMAYEGSTDNVGDWNGSAWGSGIARSSDMVSWTKYSGNPVTPTAVGAWNYNGPEMIIIGGYTYLYVTKSVGGGCAGSKRYKLVWD